MHLVQYFDSLALIFRVSFRIVQDKSSPLQVAVLKRYKVYSVAHFSGPLYACNNMKLVYLCTLEALEIKKSLWSWRKIRKKSIFSKLSAIGVFATHPPTLLYAISIQEKILIILDDPLVKWWIWKFGANLIESQLEELIIQVMWAEKYRCFL